MSGDDWKRANDLFPFFLSSVNVYFYLEDDSVHVSEPKTQDSGIPQGIH